MTEKPNYLELLKKNAMLIILVLVYIAFIIASKGQMFQPMFFYNLITQNAYVFILASGMLICMLTGGNIDLACGSFVCFLGAVGAVCMYNKGMGVAVSILIMLGIGLVYGIILGFLIAYVNVPPWIATLAGYLAFRGWGTAILNANSDRGSISPLPDGFLNLFSGVVGAKANINIAGTSMNIPCLALGIIGSLAVVILLTMSRNNKRKKGYEAESLTSVVVKSALSVFAIMLISIKLAMFGGLPVVLIWVIAIVLIYSFITSKLTIGRYFYTIGGNAEATRLSGINTKVIMFVAYLNMAILTVITSFIVTARFQAANSTAGNYFEMDAIAACVVGGVSAYGGSGSIFGMVIGATLIGVINLGMYTLGWEADSQKIVKGLVLLAAVVFDIVANKKNNSTK